MLCTWNNQGRIIHQTNKLCSVPGTRTAYRAPKLLLTNHTVHSTKPLTSYTMYLKENNQPTACACAGDAFSVRRQTGFPALIKVLVQGGKEISSKWGWTNGSGPCYNDTAHLNVLESGINVNGGPGRGREQGQQGTGQFGWPVWYFAYKMVQFAAWAPERQNKCRKETMK